MPAGPPPTPWRLEAPPDDHPDDHPDDLWAVGAGLAPGTPSRRTAPAGAVEVTRAEYRRRLAASLRPASAF